jgi:pimeloyl-ACP methyl ester carboxylesterase
MRLRINGWSLGLAAMIVGGSVGCSQLRPPTEEEMDRGYVLFLPGVETTGVHLNGMIAGLRDGGEDRAIDVDMWGVRPFGVIANLDHYEANCKEAARLAGKVADYRRAHPDAPVTIIGYSAGGGMALFTAERLPEDVELDRIVLIAAAISPRYNLSKSIARCRRGIVNIYSEMDWAIVGFGTEVFGTMDRKNTVSAGYTGFENGNGVLSTRPGLTQIGWVPAWRKLGHGGDHGGYLARAWARTILAPQVRVETIAASQPAAKR